jgi:hypothetical protein
MRAEKIQSQLPLQNKHFLIVILCFSLVEAAMNAWRRCKLCQDCFTSTGHGVMVFIKHLDFLIFLLPKRPLRPCQLVA